MSCARAECSSQQYTQNSDDFMDAPLRKLLRKFLFKKKINIASLFETYDFMDALLTIEDLQECNTPKFLARFSLIDLLRINLNNVITESEATSLKFLSKENSVPLSAEIVSQKKDENAPTPPIVPQHLDKEAEEDATEHNVVTSKAETSSPTESRPFSGDGSFFLRAMSHVIFHIFDTC